MLRIISYCIVVCISVAVFQAKTAEGQPGTQPPCVKSNVVSYNCAAEKCYQCTIRNSGDYSSIPLDATVVSLSFSASNALGPSSRLPALTNLRVLYMSVSNLGQNPTIPNGFFSSCQRLVDLTISNPLNTPLTTTLASGSLEGLSNLTRLSAIGLGIQAIPQGLLMDLTSLQSINLGWNNLIGIASGTFTHQQSLIALSLRLNNFSSLANVSFEGLYSLQKIDLSMNQIRSIGQDVSFRPLHNLTEINLESNLLTRIDSYAFTGLGYLQNLFLNKNLLTDLTVNTFDGLTNLKQLDLRNNLLQDIPRNLLSSLKSMEVLRVEGNRLKSISAYTFAGLQKLKSLNLDDSNIESIKDGAFEGLESLETLSLMNNRITKLGRNSLPSLPRLGVFNLRNNSLETIEIGTMNGLNRSALTTLDLSLNPWNCNCSNYWLILWLQLNNLSRIVTDEGSTTCYSPEDLRNSSFLRAYDFNHTCQNPFPTTTLESPTPVANSLASEKPEEAGLSREAEIGIIVGSVAGAFIIIVIVVLAVYYRVTRYRFWDRKRAESVASSHHQTRKNGATVSPQELQTTIGSQDLQTTTDSSREFQPKQPEMGYYNLGVESDDESKRSQQLPVNQNGGVADVGISVIWDSGSMKKPNAPELNGYGAYDNSGLYND